jgi:hypothetical protein
LLHGQHQSSRLQGERTPKLGDCAIGDFQEMVMGNYHQGSAERRSDSHGLIYINAFSPLNQQHGLLDGAQPASLLHSIIQCRAPYYRKRRSCKIRIAGSKILRTPGEHYVIPCHIFYNIHSHPPHTFWRPQHHSQPLLVWNWLLIPEWHSG